VEEEDFEIQINTLFTLAVAVWDTYNPNAGTTLYMTDVTI